MGTKTISITDEAYERLAGFKEGNESFSDVVNKLSNKHSLKELIGLLNKDEALELKNNIKETRKRLRDNVDRTALKLK